MHNCFPTYTGCRAAPCGLKDVCPDCRYLKLYSQPMYENNCISTNACNSSSDGMTMQPYVCDAYGEIRITGHGQCYEVVK